MHPIQIAPSIIAADFSYLRAEVARAEQAGADMLHLDIMDGHFVPNITFGPAVVKTIRTLTKLPLDVHLMISRPRKYVTSFVEAGASSITFHVEIEDGHIYTLISELNSFDCKVGISVKPKTPVLAVKDYFNQIDRLLIMTVEPGFGGQRFMPDMLPKVQEAYAIRKAGGYKFDIQVDGGLDRYTVGPSVQAGAEVIVAGTSVFGRPDAEVAIRELREAAARALAEKKPE